MDVVGPIVLFWSIGIPSSVERTSLLRQWKGSARQTELLWERINNSAVARDGALAGAEETILLLQCNRVVWEDSAAEYFL